MIHVVTMEWEDPEFADMMRFMSSNDELVRSMCDEADTHYSEINVPGTYLVVVCVDNVPVAWCAARIVDSVLKCFANYERPGYRGHRYYEMAYTFRHLTVVSRLNMTSSAYLFINPEDPNEPATQPIELHERDGWSRTGRMGTTFVGGVNHTWCELWRVPN